jgi:hypothetical protein
MPENVLNVWTEIVWIGVGALLLLIFAITMAIRHSPKTPPGSSGHRPEGEAPDETIVRPDGYIDSFAGVIEEAGGGTPPIVKWFIPIILLWWLIYLITRWQ